MHWSELITEEAKRLIEAGLARIHRHLESGGSLGIIAAAQSGATPAENEVAFPRLVSRFRQLGYGPIKATGRSEWGPEASLVIPDALERDLVAVGNEFGQEAIIHVPAGGKKNAVLHFLDAAGRKAGTREEIGPAHFNTPNRYGVTILKGLGYHPKDERQPTRSFTFGHKNAAGVIESLIVPPRSQLNPFARPYV